VGLAQATRQRAAGRPAQDLICAEARATALLVPYPGPKTQRRHGCAAGAYAAWTVARANVGLTFIARTEGHALMPQAHSRTSSWGAGYMSSI
jgi:hypothetical protein